MAQECGFFNAELEGGEYDRVYNAEQFAEYFASFVGNGVFGGSMSELVVVENETPNMSVNVSTGKAWINGWWYKNNDLYNLPVDVADGVLNRIDIVVLRWGSIERDMWVQVVKGTPSANPVAPTITRNADYYDLKLCEISIPAGAVNIRQVQITDTRPITEVCGFVTGLIDQIDAEDLFLQLQSQFNIWFDHMKDQLSEDAAGHLQLEIDDVNNLKQDKTDNALITVAKTIVGAINELFNNKVDKIEGKGLSTNDFTSTLLSKLNGIAEGATKIRVKGNAESSYRVGDVNITKADIGLGNVDNTADANKSVNYAVSAATAGSANSATSADNATKWNGLIEDVYTDNTTDAWVLVINGNKIQHKTINQNLNTYDNPTFTGVNVSGEVFKSTGANIQILANSDSSTCYLRAGSVECVYASSLEKRPIYASNFVVGSSRRIKKNIVDMTNEEASKILDVDVVDFDYIKEVGGQKNQHGVIAEDVKEIIPSVVTIPEEDDGKCYDKVPSVDYSKFVPYLIKMIQIQQKEIKELKNRVYDLENGY